MTSRLYNKIMEKLRAATLNGERVLTIDEIEQELRKLKVELDNKNITLQQLWSCL